MMRPALLAVALLSLVPASQAAGPLDALGPAVALDLDDIGVARGVCVEARVAGDADSDGEQSEVGVHGSEGETTVELEKHGAAGGEVCVDTTSAPSPCTIWVFPPQSAVACAKDWVLYLCGDICYDICRTCGDVDLALPGAR